ncbi:hypothetical protein ACFU7Y_29335 [Kitasatospora sp. NPDC057542]|uniref:hypothetical protein n=1 Tax=Kitasatospora sp. NPDC057542 TaxID=3346162 RepID=UPI00367D79DF
MEHIEVVYDPCPELRFPDVWRIHEEPDLPVHCPGGVAVAGLVGQELRAQPAFVFDVVEVRVQGLLLLAVRYLVQLHEVAVRADGHQVEWHDREILSRNGSVSYMIA